MSRKPTTSRSYDSWKTEAPDNEEKPNKCYYCGEPCNDMYCSRSCKKADVSEKS